MVRPGTQFNSVLGLVANGYKPRRNKLKSHDFGEDRHNKGVAHFNKVNRTSLEHQRTVSGMRRTSKARKPKVLKTLKLLEAFDVQQQ